MASDGRMKDASDEKSQSVTWNYLANQILLNAHTDYVAVATSHFFPASTRDAVFDHSTLDLLNLAAALYDS